MPDFDPKSNGHRLVKGAEDPPPRGGGILMLAAVSGLTALNLLLGAGAGAVIARLLGLKGRAIAAPMLAAAGLGGAIGVWVGVRVALRLSGGSGRAAARWGTAGGIAGLVAAVAFAASAIGPLIPVIAVLLPGAGAMIGHSMQGRRWPVPSSPQQPSRKRSPTKR